MILRTLLAALAALCLAGPLAAQVPIPPTNPRDDGPAALILTYHVAPADRLAFRRAVEADGASAIARLKAQGKVRDYQLLWNRYVDDPAWTMSTFVQFATPQDLAAWRAVEDKAPAALPAAALALVKSIDTTPADLMREHRNEAPGAPPSVFLVVPYDYLIGTDAYVNYVDGYVLKQTEGWMAEGALTGYRFYLARYGTVRPWSSLLLLEYRGDAGLGARIKVVEKVRNALASDAEWSALAKGKGNIREERTAAVADPLIAREAER